MLLRVGVVDLLIEKKMHYGLSFNRKKFNRNLKIYM